MKTIAIWNSKGGCGKSTIAQNLAGYFSKQKKSVDIVDLDEEQQTSLWFGSQNNASFKCVAKENVGELVNAEIIIADYPANVAGVKMFGAGTQENIVVVPLKASPADFYAVKRHLPTHIKNVVYVVSMVDLRRNIDKDFLKMLKNEGNVVFSVSNRSIYVRAMAEGKTVFELSGVGGYVEAQREMGLLGDYISKLL